MNPAAAAQNQPPRKKAPVSGAFSVLHAFAFGNQIVDAVRTRN
jgi:hypothetical protein